MVMPHNERVGRGLEAVRAGIGPICEVAWKAAYGDAWLAEVHSRDKGAVGMPDPHDLGLLLAQRLKSREGVVESNDVLVKPAGDKVRFF